MFNLRAWKLGAAACVILGIMSFVGAGCGLDRIQGPLPDAILGFSLADLKAIQSDSTLTTDQKRQQIRAAVGAPDTPEGDRLVQFLLNFNVP